MRMIGRLTRRVLIKLAPPSRASNADDFMSNVGRMAKKIQGALPIIGLISRLASDEGGFDELAYPEYCRGVINTASTTFKVALSDLEKRHGRLSNSKYVLLVLWMVKTGSTLVPARDIINSVKRMRITQDIEIEIERFSGTREKAIKKFSMMTIPEGKPREKAILAVDALCVLALGVKDGEIVEEEDSKILASLIRGAFPDTSEADVEAAITGRTSRATLYSATAAITTTKP